MERLKSPEQRIIEKTQDSTKVIINEEQAMPPTNLPRLLPEH